MAHAVTAACFAASLALSVITAAEGAGGWTGPGGDFHVRLAYRQVEDGKPTPALFLLELVCIGNRCKLETLTLNGCLSLSGSQSVQSPSSTTSFNTEMPWYGSPTLTVTRAGNVVLATETFRGGAMSYRFVLFTDPPTNPPGQLSVRRVKFSGSLDKYSTVLGRQLAIPLKFVEPGMAPVACPFWVE